MAPLADSKISIQHLKNNSSLNRLLQLQIQINLPKTLDSLCHNRLNLMILNVTANLIKKYNYLFDIYQFE